MTQNDSDTTIKPDRIMRFQYTSLDANSNKWYVYEVYGSGPSARVVGKYGRVGDKGQEHDYGVIGDVGLRRLVEERVTKKGYHPVDLVNPTSGIQVPIVAVQGFGPVAELAQIIFSEAGEAIQSYLNTTVDQLSPLQIQRARSLLDTFSTLRSSATLNTPDMLRSLVENYYRTIPTILPRRIDPDELVRTFDLSEKEVQLQQLEAAIASLAVTEEGGTQANALGAEIEAVDAKSAEYKSLHHFLTSTASGRIEIFGIFRVEIPAERAAYKANKRGKDNVRLLLHGTRNPNVRHILRSGLIVPRHASNGRAFGDGIYFADKAGKAQNYVGTASSYSGSYGNRKSAPYMMLCSEVALGRIYKTRGGNVQKCPSGYDSVLGEAYGSYAYNEYIVYQPNQCTVRYLVTFNK